MRESSLLSGQLEVGTGRKGVDLTEMQPGLKLKKLTLNSDILRYLTTDNPSKKDKDKDKDKQETKCATPPQTTCLEPYKGR